MLLSWGADPQARDGDDDTALDALLSLQDEDEALEAHVAALRALVSSPRQRLEKKDIEAICGWLRLLLPEEKQQEVLADLRQRVGEELLNELLNYSF